MDELVKKIMAIFEQLNPKEQKAFIWVMENREFVNHMCQEEMTKEKWDKYMEKALKENDVLMVMLLQYKKAYDERKRQENCQDEE